MRIRICFNDGLLDSHGYYIVVPKTSFCKEVSPLIRSSLLAPELIHFFKSMQSLDQANSGVPSMSTTISTMINFPPFAGMASLHLLRILMQLSSSKLWRKDCNKTTFVRSRPKNTHQHVYKITCTDQLSKMGKKNHANAYLVLSLDGYQIELQIELRLV